MTWWGGGFPRGEGLVQVEYGLAVAIGGHGFVVVPDTVSDAGVQVFQLILIALVFPYLQCPPSLVFQSSSLSGPS